MNNLVHIPTTPAAQRGRERKKGMERERDGQVEKDRDGQSRGR